MTARPQTQPRRLVLLPADGQRRPGEGVRRFRLGRLGLDPPPGADGERFAYLKQGHD